MPFDSSTVMTPSFPTFSITSAMRLPISSSCAEREATCVICSLPSTGIAVSDTALRSAVTPFSIPRLIAIGSDPAAMFRNPSLMIACANTVAVVVPSPATSAVLLAASFNS